MDKQSFSIYGRTDNPLHDTVQLLRKRNIGVVIHDEYEWNKICVNRAKEKRQAQSSLKDKGKGKENEVPWRTDLANVDTCTTKILKNSHPLMPSSSVNMLHPRTPDTLNFVNGGRTPITIESSIRRPFQSRYQFDLNCMPTPRDLTQEFSTVCPNKTVPYPLFDLNVVPSQDDLIQDFPITFQEKDSTCVIPHINRSIMPPTMESNHRQITSGRHFLGEMDIECPHCKALHWMDERLTNSSRRSPLFGMCCFQGKIKLPMLNTPPRLIKELYDGNDTRSKSFRQYIRQYNACHAFTSLGVKLDPRVLAGRGPTSFVIHGELRHRTGSLIPEPGQDPVYAQLYIYDPQSAMDVRCRRNENLNKDVIRIIQETLLEHNPFTHKFRQAYEILRTQDAANSHLPVFLHYNSVTDRRRFNLPTVDEIAVILPGDGTEISSLRDIVLHYRGNNGLMQINECHPAYLPLHYVLLFPCGELGWEPGLKQWNVSDNRPTNERLTQLQYYCYRLFDRYAEFSTILRGGKLFQEFLVDAWASTEQNRLTYVKLNQEKFRTELYHDFMEDVTITHGVGPNRVGRRMFLPSSHIGSPRYMFEIFQDSMAITRYHHHPDIFLTMTANPKWPEITNALQPNQKALDRPDLVSRVFELKRRCLMKELQKTSIFGRKKAHVYTIEFQKRGLPHMHLLIFLDGPDKIRTCAQIDKMVSAEFPDPTSNPLLFETIKNCMVHGPCGARNKSALCMENGKCTKGYPKPFCESTNMGQDGYAIYQRRNDGKSYTVRDHPVDNRDIVPYNPYLSTMFNCHINVEVCAGIRCVKYIHKYIYKGGDRTTMVLGGRDEIQQYLNSRYIGPPEAAWRILGFSLHEEMPNVIRLALHLPGMHMVNFNPDEPVDDIVSRISSQVSTLTGFLAYYSANPNAPKYTYQEFPQYYVWKNKMWLPRQRGFAIGRMYFVGPNQGEVFYLRLLLTHVKGPSSWEELRTINNILYPTFKSACVASGLIEDDEEWVQCLQEASIMQTGYQLRRLFTTILTQCCPIHPHELWKQFSIHICDDLGHKIRINFGISNPSQIEIEDYGLYLINHLLHDLGKSLTDFPPMPQHVGNWDMIMGNRLILEHKQLQISARQEDVEARINDLNQGQHEAFSAINSSILNNVGKIFFLSGGAGTGKTFLYNTLALKFRSLGHTVVTVASSGIASLLLIGGRTAHSTFRIPLDIHDKSVCGFSKQSVHAELFRETSLIVWDEVPMQHKHCVEAVDRTLRDIRDNNKAFGGITVILGGDFRQVLPVIPKGVREQIVSACLRSSTLWLSMCVLTLNVNMRLNDSDPHHDQFTYFLNEIGSNPDEIITIPSSIHKCQHLHDLLSRVYPQLDVIGTVTPKYLTERTILSSRNDDVTIINKLALNTFPGDSTTYLAADKLSCDDEVDGAITNRYPNEYLNSLDPPGLSPFKLELKLGSPVMLLRNLAPNDGLCNGTRLMITRCASRIIEAQILTGDKAGDLVFIPRISLTPSSGELPFHMTRRQFPIRLAYSMTINKSQGQSVKFVGIDLRTPVFSHGQLYVAMSRCTSSDRISCLLPEIDKDTTTNIVYPEIWDETSSEYIRLHANTLQTWDLQNKVVVCSNGWSIYITTHILHKVMKRLYGI